MFLGHKKKDKIVVHLKEAGVDYIWAKYFKTCIGKEISGNVVMGLKI